MDLILKELLVSVIAGTPNGGHEMSGLFVIRVGIDELGAGGCVVIGGVIGTLKEIGIKKNSVHYWRGREELGK